MSGTKGSYNQLNQFQNSPSPLAVEQFNHMMITGYKMAEKGEKEDVNNSHNSQRYRNMKILAQDPQNKTMKTEPPIELQANTEISNLIDR